MRGGGGGGGGGCNFNPGTERSPPLIVIISEEVGFILSTLDTNRNPFTFSY